MDALPAPTSMASIGWLILTLAGLAVALNQIYAFASNFREKPVPAETYVTKAEFSRQYAEQRDRLMDLAARIEAARVAREADRDDFHREVAAVRAEIREDFGRVHERLDQMPSQLITTLKNTGAIS